MVLFVIAGCDEKEILKEVPLDFASPENSFVTVNDFNSAVYTLYALTRQTISDGEHRPLDYMYGTDLGYNGAQQLNDPFNNPKSVWDRQKLSDHLAMFRQCTDDTIRNFYPYQSKVTTPGQQPAELFVDPHTPICSPFRRAKYRSDASTESGLFERICIFSILSKPVFFSSWKRSTSSLTKLIISFKK